MLVLSRQREESIMIGEGDDSIEIKVIEIRGDKVRLGIEAPREVGVHRREIWETIQRERAEQAVRSKRKAHPEGAD